jgi:septal ring factor EnvC (AmiA/AmiB activator)
MPPPATGAIQSGFGETGPSERANGLVLSTPPYAVVRAPALSTLRYAGPVGRFAEVAILEPEPGTLIVLAGLGRIDRMVGETILAGEPIGAMDGPPPASEEFLIDVTLGNGTLSQESLYIELRRDGAPVDPAPWFAFPVERKSG